MLLYHSISDSADPPDRLAVSRRRYREQLEAVVASGRTPLTVGRLAAGLRGDLPLPERPVAITFDDAYDDTLGAVELLCGVELRCTVYVTTGQVDSPQMIRGEQLDQLRDSPERVELGAHTVDHPYLDELGPAEVSREVTASKRQLETRIERPVDTFAYPYGAHDPSVRNAVVAAGYTSAAAVKNALSHRDDDPWAIARWTVTRSTSAKRLSEVLEGEGVPLAWSGERHRTKMYRRFRRLRRRVSRIGDRR